MLSFKPYVILHIKRLVDVAAKGQQTEMLYIFF